jgi:N-acetylglucosaminyl-diphospho-decaprenol L-rhamnosyltransferase
MLTLSVVSHGHGAMLASLLKQLDEQHSLVGVRVIVTLNLRGEPFEAPLCKRLDLEIVRNERPFGFGANHNAAFLRCKTRWFGILNPDLRLFSGEPFSRLMELGDLLPRAGAVAPLIVDAIGRTEDSVRENLTLWSLFNRHFLGRRLSLNAGQVAESGKKFYWIAGMCILVKSAAFRTIGGFDERFFLYCEDYDLCARLYSANYAIKSEPEVQLVHEARRDSHHSLRHLRWHITSLMKVWTSRAFWRVTIGFRA